MRELVSRIVLGLFSINEVWFTAVAAILMIVEAVLSHLVILKVNYTEIDWSTYMQQVECYSRKGILNYTRIGGDTGPVVYPAGHIFAYRILHLLTNSGRNIRVAQHIFQGFYLFNIFMVFRILQKTMRVPPIVLLLVTVTGYRIHSIFMLRLFNDPLAMMLFYVAMDRFLNEKWLVGCIFYSVAVSIKMNVLLFAPAMFFTLILNNSYMHTFGYLALCGVIQLYIGSPFLLYDWKSYVQRSFDLGRVFMFKWTVNWRFLPEELFLDKRFHIALLVGHITVLGLFAWFMWFRRINGLPSSMYVRIKNGVITATGAVDTYYAFCTANLIGIAFSRSLHYQFYSWYFHQLPFLLFCDYPNVASISDIPWKQFLWKVPVLLAIELSWNVYPSTWWSSGLLHVCHVIIFWHLISTRIEKPTGKCGTNIVDKVGNTQEMLDDCLEEHKAIIPRLPDFKIYEDGEEIEEEEEELVLDEEALRERLNLKETEEQKMKRKERGFSEYYDEQKDSLKDAHKVYYTFDGQLQISGLSPMKKKDEMKLSDRLKSLYTQALQLQSELKEEHQNRTENVQVDESDDDGMTDEEESEESIDDEQAEESEGSDLEDIGVSTKPSTSTPSQETTQKIFEKSNGIRHRTPTSHSDEEEEKLPNGTVHS